MQYPDKLTIIVPQFTMVIDQNKRAYSNRLVFLPAFAVLHAEQQNNDDMVFRERVELDPAGDQSIELLAKLGDELEPDTTLCGWRLDRQIASLVRVPRDSDRDEDGSAPLLRLSSALANPPIDVGWFGRASGLSTLINAAARHGLPAQWQDQRSAKVTIDGPLLAARSRSVWAAIADRLFEKGEARRKAFASFDRFISRGGVG